ncbi:MAG: hypothetical protein HY320_06025 [Armatimonadetes bacterium]|nr:hypothetical protein [Armatimonadota bacterium]
MKKWVVAGAAAAVLTASVVIVVAIQRSRHQDALDRVPEMIAECFQRIQQLEAELSRHRPAPKPIP